MAEDMFIRQMKRRRAALGLSQGELAERVSAMGGSMYQQTIAKLEAGQRALKLSEADVLARALDTTVQDMLSSAFSDSAPAIMKETPTLAELTAQASAVRRRLARSLHDLEQVSRAAEEARAMLDVATDRARRAEMERHIQQVRYANLSQEYDGLKAMIGIQNDGADEFLPSPTGNTDEYDLGWVGDQRVLSALGEKFLQARYKAGLTRDQLSYYSHIPASTLDGMEKGDFSGCGDGSLEHVRIYLRVLSVALDLQPEATLTTFDVALQAGQRKDRGGQDRKGAQ